MHLAEGVVLDEQELLILLPSDLAVPVTEVGGGRVKLIGSPTSYCGDVICRILGSGMSGSPARLVAGVCFAECNLQTCPDFSLGCAKIRKGHNEGRKHGI